MQSRHLVVATPILAIPAMAIAGLGNPTLPEPETLALLGFGAVVLVVARRRKRK
jgi:hypothetical protein